MSQRSEIGSGDCTIESKDSARATSSGFWFPTLAFPLGEGHDYWVSFGVIDVFRGKKMSCTTSASLVLARCLPRTMRDGSENSTNALFYPARSSEDAMHDRAVIWYGILRSTLRRSV